MACGPPWLPVGCSTKDDKTSRMCEEKNPQYSGEESRKAWHFWLIKNCHKQVTSQPSTIEQQKSPLPPTRNTEWGANFQEKWNGLEKSRRKWPATYTQATKRTPTCSEQSTSPLSNLITVTYHAVAVDEVRSIGLAVDGLTVSAHEANVVALTVSAVFARKRNSLLSVRTEQAEESDLRRCCVCLKTQKWKKEQTICNCPPQKGKLKEPKKQWNLQTKKNRQFC